MILGNYLTLNSLKSTGSKYSSIRGRQRTFMVSTASISAVDIMKSMIWQTIDIFYGIRNVRSLKAIIEMQKLN
jgi:hypothetical protein